MFWMMPSVGGIFYNGSNEWFGFKTGIVIFEVGIKCLITHRCIRDVRDGITATFCIKPTEEDVAVFGRIFKAWNTNAVGIAVWVGCAVCPTV